VSAARVYLSDYEMRVRSVRCSLCNARPQANCRNEQGAEGRPHVARLEAYDREHAKPEA
jgi:hypothetical protein